MSFSAQDVVKLRHKTGAGMMECKNALKEANGDLERASEILRQKGLIAAASKSEKTSDEGIVISKISNDKKVGAIVEINSQTDFVAKNELFQDLAKNVVSTVVEKKPKSLDELLDTQIKNETISNLISESIAKIGENIKVRRFNIFELNSGSSGVIGTYIHPVGNKIGVLIKLSTSSQTKTEELTLLAKDICMHIAASQPQPEYVDKSEIPQTVVEKEKQVELGKEDLAKKPLDIKEKIVKGRLEKLLSQKCLLEQPYIKDGNITVDALIKDTGKKLNTEIKVIEFVRYNVGEMVEKFDSEDKKSPVGSTNK